MHLSPLAVKAAGGSAIIDLLFNVPFIMCVGILCLSLFCYAILCVHSSFAITLKRKRKLVASLLLSNRFIVAMNSLWLFLMLPWIGLQWVILVFPDHTHLFFIVLGLNSCALKDFARKHYFEFSKQDL